MSNSKLRTYERKIKIVKEILNLLEVYYQYPNEECIMAYPKLLQLDYNKLYAMKCRLKEQTEEDFDAWIILENRLNK